MKSLEPHRSPIRWVERLLVVVAIVLLGSWTVAHVESWIYQAFQSQRLEDTLEGGTRLQSASGGPIGRIEIPSAELSAVIAEGVDRHTLLHAVGHVPGTALPGQSGNVALAGHRDSFFRGLKHTKRNDAVRIRTPDGTFDYRVEWTAIVEPERGELLASSGRKQLTLVTCYPFNYIGQAPKRFVVRANQVPARAAP